MEQAGGAGGDQPSGPGVGGGGRAKVSLCGACGSGLVSRALGRLRDPPWGHYGPCARSSLETRPDRRETRGPELRQRSKGVCREPQQGAERRAGPRHGPVISGDPEMGATARRATGCGVPHQRLSALCSPRFFRGAEEGQRGTRPPRNGRAERWLARVIPAERSEGRNP